MNSQFKKPVGPTTITILGYCFPEIFIAGVIITCLVGGWAYNQMWNYKVCFIIPDNYRGVIIIYKDEHNYAPYVSTTYDTYTYSVPESGKLPVKDFTPFGKFHFPIANYKSGKSIRTVSPEYNIGKNEVTFDYIGTVLNDQGLFTVASVGTTDEHIRLEKQYGLRK